jgi:RHS repeat-associated protein
VLLRFCGGGFAASGAINGDRKGANWGNGGGWADVSYGSFPDWLEIDFNGSKTIDEIDVFTVQDNYANPVEPTSAMTFSAYGQTAYYVQYWNPDTSGWVTVAGGSITNNNKIWRTITFAAITTSKIRVLTNASIDNGYSHLTEVEAWSASSATLQWLVPDQLGTPRMIADASGSLEGIKQHDYLPFGEELFAGAGGRTTTQGYSANDSVRQQFTQKERDNETGLDYFEARYYANSEGRFTSADEFPGGAVEVFAAAAADNPTFYADLTNPQTLSKYQYCVNNPLRYTDPSGHQGQGQVDTLTQFLGYLFTALLNQKDPDERERRAPLSLNADEVSAKASVAAGQQARANNDFLKHSGMDLGALQFIEDTV